MKYFNKTIYSLVAVLLLLGAVSCDLTETDNRSYDGPDKIAFNNPTSGSKAVSAGSPSSVNANAEVQLIADQQDSDLTVDVAVVDSSTSANSSNYTVPSSVTISANSSITSYQFSVNGSGLSAGDIRTVAITLKGNDKVEVAENYQKYTLTFQAQ